MTTFDEREKAYEAKLARDEEVKFKVAVRRSKLLGFWAAEISGKPAEDYANALVAALLEGKSDETIFHKIRADFDAAGVALSDHQIRRKMQELLVAAADDIAAMGKSP